jgi:hypothetical protein
MWASDDIRVEIDDAEDNWVIIKIETPAGLVSLAGSLEWKDRVLRIDGAHLQGLGPGSLGRSGLNAIGKKLLKEADVDKIVIQGANRASGPSQGKQPSVICFPRG